MQTYSKPGAAPRTTSYQPGLINSKIKPKKRAKRKKGK